MAKTPIFEHVTCSRCCGSGHYSFNLVHGTVCYGCSGAGVVLTKRGKAARQWLVEQRSVRADQLAVGDVAYFDMYPSKGGWSPINEITRTENGMIELRFTLRRENCFFHFHAGTLVPVAVSAERIAELKEQALAYQATLTKDGKPAKRSKAVTA